MEFAIPDNMVRTLAQVRRFIDQEIVPLEGRLVAGSFADLVPTLEDERQAVRDMGLWLPQLGTEHGGAGLGFMEHALLSEELGRSPLGHYVFNCQAPDAGNMEILVEFGTAQQKERYLKPLAAGQIRSCFAMTEPEHAGSNPVWMSTTALADGQEYVINGHKWFASSADGAQFAVVMVVTDPDAEKHRRASHPRFAGLDQVVNGLSRAAAEAIEAGEVP